MDNGTIRVVCPRHMSGLYGIEVQTKYFTIMEDFVSKILQLKEWQPFFQGGSREFYEAECKKWDAPVMEQITVDGGWAFFEFWSEMDYQRQTVLIALAELFANGHGLTFDIR